MEAKEEVRHTTVRYSTLVAVWAALVFFTWLTVRVAGMRIGGLSFVSPFIFASLKASLVLAFFMHLKYEKVHFALLVALALAFMAVSVWLVYTDVAFRG